MNIDAPHREILRRRLATALEEQRISIALPLLDELIALAANEPEERRRLERQRAEIQRTRLRYLAKWGLGLFTVMALFTAALVENERFLGTHRRPPPPPPSVRAEAELQGLPRRPPGGGGSGEATLFRSRVEDRLPDNSRPQVGSAALALSELRWCEFEAQRLNALRRYAEAAREQGHLTIPEAIEVTARINRFVATQTSLCGNRIRSRSLLEQAQAEAAQHLELLEREAAELLERILPRRQVTAATSATAGSGMVAEAAAPRSPDPALVMQVQLRLAALGFDPGPPDGALGARTRTALRAFKRLRGLKPENDTLDDATMAALFR